MQSSSRSTMERNPWIDFIRGLCIISVILFHIEIRLPTSISLPTTLFKSGYYGVIVFFVISGFLITSMSIQRWKQLNQIALSEFYLLRFSRIAPCLIALLCLLSLFDLLHLKDYIITTTSLSNAIVAALTFRLNWLEAKTGYLPASWDVLWSLSVEEMFYLFFPLLCLFLKDRLQLLVVLVSFVILGPIARTLLYTNEMWADHSYLSCMDGIAFGCIAGIIVNSIQPSRLKSYLVLAAGLSIFTFVFVFRKACTLLGITQFGLNVSLLELGMAMILMSLTWLPAKRGVNFLTKPIMWYGKNSYEVYLTHALVLLFFFNFFTFNTSLTNVLLDCLVVLVTAGVIGHYVSKFTQKKFNLILGHL